MEGKQGEVAQSAELGYIYATYHLMMKEPEGNPVIDDGKFFEVWKNQADGG